MKALEAHQGKTWRDMPGRDDMGKKMNFAMFKRGKLNPRFLSVEHKEMLARAGRSTAKGVVYATDGEELKLRVQTTAELRCISVYVAALEISRQTTGMGFDRLYNVLRGTPPMTERFAVWVRAWLEKNRTEEAAE